MPKNMPGTRCVIVRSERISLLAPPEGRPGPPAWQRTCSTPVHDHTSWRLLRTRGLWGSCEQRGAEKGQAKRRAKITFKGYSQHTQKKRFGDKQRTQSRGHLRVGKGVEVALLCAVHNSQVSVTPVFLHFPSPHAWMKRSSPYCSPTSFLSHLSEQIAVFSLSLVAWGVNHRHHNECSAALIIDRLKQTATQEEAAFLWAFSRERNTNSTIYKAYTEKKFTNTYSLHHRRKRFNILQY